MARILVLAQSGFGKTTSLGSNPDLGIKGLPPNQNYIISVTSKPLPFRGSTKQYPVVEDLEHLKEGRRIISNNPKVIEGALLALAESPIKNIVIDDFNYIMQDYYMKNALRTGWDAPKQIGADMGKIFDAMEKFKDANKHIIVLAHGEENKGSDGRIYLKLKTTGKMVDEYVTPEGKFDIVLVGKSRYDKKVIKEFVTNEDEFYSSPKSPHGMFKDTYIPNDMGLVIETVDKYYQSFYDEEVVS